jgi:uncharacterized membrane protein
MNYRFVLITVCSLLLLGNLTACRHGGFHGGFDEFDMEACAKRIASRLDLSDVQKEQLMEIANDVAVKVKRMRADCEVKHQELVALVRQETISRDTANRMMTEKVDRMRNIADYAVDRLIAFHATLSPEQREELAGQIEKRAAMHRLFSR